MSQTYRLWQFIDVEVGDRTELYGEDGGRWLLESVVQDFIESIDEGAGIGVEFLGEDVEPYSTSFAPQLTIVEKVERTENV